MPILLNLVQMPVQHGLRDFRNLRGSKRPWAGLQGTCEGAENRRAAKAASSKHQGLPSATSFKCLSLLPQHTKPVGKSVYFIYSTFRKKGYETYAGPLGFCSVLVGRC